MPLCQSDTLLPSLSGIPFSATNLPVDQASLANNNQPNQDLFYLNFGFELGAGAANNLQPYGEFIPILTTVKKVNLVVRQGAFPATATTVNFRSAAATFFSVTVPANQSSIISFPISNVAIPAQTYMYITMSQNALNVEADFQLEF
jgi:hypothetical protein